MNNTQKYIVIPSKTKLIFPNLPENKRIELISEIDLNVDIFDVNGDKVSDSGDAIINIEDNAMGLNVSFTLYQLQCITGHSEKRVFDAMRNHID